MAKAARFCFFIVATIFLLSTCHGKALEENADWISSLKSDKLDDEEIESLSRNDANANRVEDGASEDLLSIDDSHAGKDLDEELAEISSKRELQDSAQGTGESVEEIIEKVNEKNIENIPVHLIGGDIATKDGDENKDDDIEKKSAVRALSYLWQDRVIPYEIAPSYSVSTKDLFQKVFDTFENKTCLKFVERNESSKTWLHIQPFPGCWSYVGRVFTGAQNLSIGSGCEYFGTISHEIMHALGFWHEQSRPDRDDFVAIYWENIIDNKESNFYKKSREAAQVQETVYDYGSVMHYGKTAFSRNGKPTIVAISDPNQNFGQRNGPSDLDWLEINKLYQCHKTGGGFSDWSNWGPCSTSGSLMTRKRQKYCFDADRSNCPGADSYGVAYETKTVSCNDPACVVKGHWSRWSSWSECNAPCKSYSTVKRTRTCTNPVPRCNGPPCNGTPEELKQCYGGALCGPDDCDFENTTAPFCHWNGSPYGQYVLKWTRLQGSTPSLQTGPSGDASENLNGTGHYVYVETSHPAVENQQARLRSKVFPPTQSRTMVFKYHHYVQQTSKAALYLFNSNGEQLLWNITGDTGNQWHTESVQFSSTSSYQMIFEMTRGSSWRGDIALDDILFLDDVTTTTTPPPTTAPKTTTTRLPTTTTTKPPTTTTESPTTTTRPPTTTTKPPTTTTEAPTTTTKPPTTTTRPPTTTTKAPTTTTRPPTTTTEAPTTTTKPPTTTTRPPTTTTKAPTTTTKPPTTTTEAPTTTTKPPTTTTRPPTTTTKAPTTTTTKPLTTTTRPPTTTTKAPTTITTKQPSTTKPPGKFIDKVSCNFEGGLCLLEQSKTDTFDWTRKRGSQFSFYSGPKYDHTTAKAGFYVFTESGYPRRKNHNAVLSSPEMQSDGEKRCIVFYYHMTGHGDHTLKVDVEYDGTKRKIFDIVGNQGRQWHRGQGTLDVPSGKSFKVHFESIKGDHYEGETALDDISVWSGACPAYDSTPSALACPIERNVRFCEWMQVEHDEGNWSIRRSSRRGRGRGRGRGKGVIFGDESTEDATTDDEDDNDQGEKSVDTTKNDVTQNQKEKADHWRGSKKGPRRALSGRRDYFASFSGRRRPNNENAILESPFIVAKKVTCMRFFAHMYGKNIGKLVVRKIDEAGSSELLKLTGNQKNRWFEVAVNIPPGLPYSLEIEATQGNKGVIAIDDIAVSEGKCAFPKTTFECDFSSGPCGLKHEGDCPWKIVPYNGGKALQWDIKDCNGYGHFEAKLSKELHIPPRGGCITLDFHIPSVDNCEFQVSLYSMVRSWLGRRKAQSRVIYHEKAKGADKRQRQAFVTIPPSRGGMPLKTAELEVNLQRGWFSCKQFTLDHLTFKEGICGNP